MATHSQIEGEAGIEEIIVRGSESHGAHEGPFEKLGLGYFGRVLDGLKEAATGIFFMLAGGIHGTVTVLGFPLIYGILATAGKPELYWRFLNQSPALFQYGAQSYTAGWQRFGSGVTRGWIPLPAEPVYSVGRGSP